MKMFVFPHSGGFGYQYNFFKNYKFSKIEEIFCYDYPRRFREDSTTSEENKFTDRVEHAINWVLEHDVLPGEYILFGHSLGAFVAYEAGLKLKNVCRISPAKVIMSSQNPPVGFEKIQENFRRLHFDLDVFLEKLGGMTTDIASNKDSMKFYKSLLNADLALIDTYCPTVPEKEERLDELMVFYADKDPILDFNQWKYWPDCAVNYKLFPYQGNHFYIYSDTESVMRQIDENL